MSMQIELRDENGNIHFHIPSENERDIYLCGSVRFKGREFRFGGVSDEMIYFIPAGNVFDLSEDWQIVGGIVDARPDDHPAA
jgi:hypothetical protein